VGRSNILLNHQLSSEIISLIESSKDYCFLVTPYYKPWQLLNRALDKAASNEKKIVFIFRNGDVKENIIKDLNLKGFDIYLVEKLHTKLYLNDNTAIITSMNLYDASKEFNYEVGYKFQNQFDVKNFKVEVIEKDILGTKPKLTLPGRYLASIEKSLIIKNTSKNTKTEEAQLKTATLKTVVAPGYCLSCRTEISYDINKPYCIECYKIWAKNNFLTKEKYCHSCGANYRSSYQQPNCYKCR